MKAVVLYGRPPEKRDILPGAVVWCNSECDPAKIQQWGASAVYCYVNAGAIQKSTPGYKKLLATKGAVGNPYPGWPGEFWGNIRHKAFRSSVLLQVRAAKTKGFTGVDFDNLNGNEAKTGLGLKWDDVRSWIAILRAECDSLGLHTSYRHVSRPSAVVAPTIWLVEDVFREDKQNTPTFHRYPAENLVSIEYHGPPKQNYSGATVILADRELKENRRLIEMT